MALEAPVQCAGVQGDFVGGFSKIPPKGLLRTPGDQRRRGKFPPQTQPGVAETKGVNPARLGVGGGAAPGASHN